MKKFLYPLFGAVLLAQLAVPAFMIWRQEMTLREGTMFKLETAPVDPYDAFRGRYVALSFKEESVSKSLAPEAKKGDRLHARLQANAEGIARVVALSADKLPDSVPVKVQWVSEDIRLVFPFERFYMDEFKALPAEEAYRQQNRREKPGKAHVTIRVRNGYAALENLYLEDQPILDYFKKLPK